MSGRRRQHAVRRTPWSGQPPASRFRYRRGHCRRRASTAVAGGACMDGRLPATAMSLPCSGEPRPCPRQMVAVRPAPSRNPGRPADTAAVSGSADTPGFRARSAQPADTDGPPLGQRTRPADTRNPQAASTVDTHDRGMGTRTLRQRPAGQPATEPSTTAFMSGRERDRKLRHRPAPPWPDRQIRSLGTAGKPASSWQASVAQESRPLR